MKTDHAIQTVDAYIAGFPDEVQKLLQRVRATIREAAPDADETISYQLPTFKLRGKPLVYFGAFTNHLGLYPAPGGFEPFKDELAPYKNAKG